MIATPTIRPMSLAVSALAVGAIAGLAAGAALSIYVALLDARKRTDGLRVRARYRASLVATPALLAGVGALVGLGAGALT